MHCLQLCKEGNRLPLPLITEARHLKQSFKSIAFSYILYNRRQCIKNLRFLIDQSPEAIDAFKAKL